MNEFRTRLAETRSDERSASAPDGRGEDLPGTALVTGGAGFIGSHLAGRLAIDGDVRVLDDLSTGDRDAVPEAATLIQGDVTDYESVVRAAEGVDVIFHLAAVVSVEESVADPVETNRTNVDGTVAVLEAAREVGARVVFASSAAVYGQPESVPVTVDEPQNPRSPYGASKTAADAYVRAYEASYDVPTVALRYFNVYGRGQRGPYSGVIDAFLGRALDGEPLVVHGDGEQTRDFVHVSDVVRANLAAAATDDTGTAYNVGTGRSVTINELASIVADAADVDAEVRHDSARPGDVRHSRAATARAADRLGFHAQVDLESGLADLVDARRGIAESPVESSR